MRKHDDLLVARLRTIVSGTTQAEVARKTGTSVANVHRYLNGMRIPAAFCSALAEGMNINPVWLLLGR